MPDHIQWLIFVQYFGCVLGGGVFQAMLYMSCGHFLISSPSNCVWGLGSQASHTVVSGECLSNIWVVQIGVGGWGDLKPCYATSCGQFFSNKLSLVWEWGL